MVENALAHEQGEKTLLTYLRPFLESVVDEYILEIKVKDVPRDKLLESGLTHLRIALKRYKHTAGLMLEGKHDVFYFSTYFNWYIRQGVLEYLHRLKVKIGEDGYYRPTL